MAASRTAGSLATLILGAASGFGQTVSPAAQAPAVPKLKTIGVVGGIGPQATMEFERQLHLAAQRRLPQAANAGYPPMVVVFHRRPPILLDAGGAPVRPVRLDPVLAEALPKLGSMVDFLVITSNGAHMVQKQMEEASGRPVLSMIDVTLDEVRSRGWKKVGVIGMGDPFVYTDRLEAMGIAFETLPPDDRHPLDLAFLGLMAGRDDASSRRLAAEAVAKLRRRGVDGVILGCSELPLLLGENANAPDLVNPIPLLAEATVARASR
jgi:aspartate racemase